MSSKEKLVISSEKEHNWLVCENEGVKDTHVRVRGKLLTTLETAITNSKQLEALKSRVKDVQTQIWNRISTDSYSIFSCRFTVSDQSRTTQSLSEKKFNSAVDEFWVALAIMIKLQLDCFKAITANLLIMAVDDQAKQGALRKEFERIINDSSLNLQNRLSNEISRILKGEVE